MPKHTPQEKTNTYIHDPENAAEVARLLIQDRMITQTMGGPLASYPDHSSLTHILDIGCGPGGWAHEVAEQYPDISVVGIDISSVMVNYAKAQAACLYLENTHFQIMDALEPLTFTDASFDLVNIRAASAFVPRELWPSLLKECVRVVRPGGYVRFTEIDSIGITNSPAFQEFQGLFTRLYHKMGFGFSPDGLTFGMTPMLGVLLSDAGCQSINLQPHVLDFSYGSSAHDSQCRNASIAFQALKTPIANMGLATERELVKLYETTLDEMQQETFRGLGYMLTALGEKPRT